MASARPVPYGAHVVGQLRVSGNHFGQRRIAGGELGWKPARLSGIEIHAEKIDLRLQNPLTVGCPQNVEAARTSQPAVTGHYPRAKQQHIVENRGLEIVHARVPYGHATAQLETALDGQTEGR